MLKFWTAAVPEQLLLLLGKHQASGWLSCLSTGIHNPVVCWECSSVSLCWSQILPFSVIADESSSRQLHAGLLRCGVAAVQRTARIWWAPVEAPDGPKWQATRLTTHPSWIYLRLIYMLSVYRTAAGTKYVCFKYFIDTSIPSCFSVKLVVLFIFCKNSYSCEVEWESKKTNWCVYKCICGHSCELENAEQKQLWEKLEYSFKVSTNWMRWNTGT